VAFAVEQTAGKKIYSVEGIQLREMRRGVNVIDRKKFFKF
jgi:hypothetical protein